MPSVTLQKYDCDRCGFTYKKSDLRRQRGMLLCCDCKDDLTKIPTPNPHWMSPRDNSDSTDAVNTSTVYTISAATGISALGQSRTYSQEGSRRHFHMHVVSDGGAITLTASPQIVAGLQGDILTLTGTSDTNTIQMDDGLGVAMSNDYAMVLEDNDSITFVYNTSSGWGETSRTKGGV